MKKLILPVLAISALSSFASADVIKCTFTEPFVSTTYSMAQQSLTIDNGSEGTKKVIKDVSFQIKGAGRFELVDKSGKVLQKLSLTGKGSDGMSDATYPYEVVDASQQKFANSGIGGCSSNSLKKIDGAN